MVSGLKSAATKALVALALCALAVQVTAHGSLVIPRARNVVYFSSSAVPPGSSWSSEFGNGIGERTSTGFSRPVGQPGGATPKPPATTPNPPPTTPATPPPTSGATITLRAGHNGQCASANPVEGARIITTGCVTTSPQQQFTAPGPGGPLRIGSSNMCWTAQGTAVNAAVVASVCNGGANQRWTQDATGRLSPASAPGMCVDGWTGQLYIWTCSPNTPNQQWTAGPVSGTPNPPAAPGPNPGPQPQTGNGGCPAGWLPAVGTLYDSWPAPGSEECVKYSGCKWAGMFKRIIAGPITGGTGPGQRLQCPNACNTAKDGTRAQFLNGGNGETCCRWPQAAVQRWSVGATWERDAALLGRSLDVMVAGRPSRVATVNIQDVCSDKDCDNCCTKNTGNGRWKMIDIEKWPASALLGFNPIAAGFDVNRVAKPTVALTGVARAGAPATGVMPLCYRDKGAAPALV